MTVWSFALGAVSILLTWALSTPLIGERATSLTNHKFFGYVWGTGLAYAGIGLMALGLGFLLRSTAGSITVVSSLLFILNIPLSIASNFWGWAGKALYLTPFVTISAVTDPFSVQSNWAAESPAPWVSHSAAVAVFAAWSWSRCSPAGSHSPAATPEPAGRPEHAGRDTAGPLPADGAPSTPPGASSAPHPIPRRPSDTMIPTAEAPRLTPR